MYAIRNDRVMFVDVSYLCLENRHSDIRGSESLVELKKKTYANRRIAGKSRKWNRRRYIRRDPRVYRYRKSRLCLSAMDRVCILTREREREREASGRSFLDRGGFRSRRNGFMVLGPASVGKTFSLWSSNFDLADVDDDDDDDVDKGETFL